MFWGYKVFKPVIWAHRGFSAQFGENSLEAFRQAYLAKAHGIECDVHTTLDGVAVIHHDPRISSQENLSVAISEVTWNALRRLTRGSINRLEDLSQLPDRGLINIELKDQGKLNTLLVESVSRTIRQYQWHQRVVLSSFSKEILRLLHLQLAECSLAALWASRLPEVQEFRELVPCVDAVHVSASFLSLESLYRFQKEGYSVVVWDVKSEAMLDEWVNAGVDGVIIDNPLRMKAKH